MTGPDHGLFVPAQAWRLKVAIDEGIRSALAGRWLSGVVLTLICWAVAVPGAFDAMTVTRLALNEQQFVAAGGNVVVVSNKEAGVPSTACDRLITITGVYGSAALTRREPATLTTGPGADIGVVSATAGVWRLLGLAPGEATGGIVSQSIADRAGLRDGDWIELRPAPGTNGAALPRTPVRISVTDTSRLGEEYTGILLPAVPGADAFAEACVVALQPAAISRLKTVLPAVLPSGSGTTVVGDRLITGRFAADYTGAYQSRPLQWSWIAVGSLLGLVWLLVRWVRRSADALYVTLGADRLTRLVLRGTEWSILATLGGAWGVALGVTTGLAFGASFNHAVTYVGRHAVASILLATAIVLLGQAGSPRSLLSDLKDR